MSIPDSDGGEIDWSKQSVAGIVCILCTAFEVKSKEDCIHLHWGSSAHEYILQTGSVSQPTSASHCWFKHHLYDSKAASNVQLLLGFEPRFSTISAVISGQGGEFSQYVPSVTFYFYF